MSGCGAKYMDHTCENHLRVGHECWCGRFFEDKDVEWWKETLKSHPELVKT